MQNHKIDDCERERLAWLETQRQEDEFFDKNFGPGSFGAHELLDRVHLMDSMFDDFVLQHPSARCDSRILSLADQISTMIARLYQEVGKWKNNGGTGATASGTTSGSTEPSAKS